MHKLRQISTLSKGKITGPYVCIGPSCCIILKTLGLLQYYDSGALAGLSSSVITESSNAVCLISWMLESLTRLSEMLSSS